MREKYCLPIIKQQKQEVLAEIERHHAEYAYFEVWLDYIEDIEVEFAKSLTELYPGKIILLFRRQLLEPIHMTLTDRLQLLQAVGKAHACVDLDIESQKAEFNYIHTNKLQLHTIGSYHNYQRTPDLIELQMIVNGIEAHNPTVVKVATFCRNETDAIRLLHLQQQLKQQHQKHIIIGMGPHGTVTRIFGSLWGNELIFAPLEPRDDSAPGQLTRTQLDTIFETLQT